MLKVATEVSNSSLYTTDETGCGGALFPLMLEVCSLPLLLETSNCSPDARASSSLCSYIKGKTKSSGDKRSKKNKDKNSYIYSKTPYRGDQTV